MSSTIITFLGLSDASEMILTWPTSPAFGRNLSAIMKPTASSSAIFRVRFAPSQLIGHLPRPLRTSSVCGADKRVLRVPIRQRLPDEIGKVLLARELVQGFSRWAKARLCLIVKVKRDKAIRSSCRHQMQQQLRSNRLAGLELPVLPSVLDARQHDCNAVRRFRLQRIQHEESLEQTTNTS
eukprot:CAMPEP_0115161194 /NCGR_PEP_ID=MMETSP0227-20121206/71213_1 /TAXON_ID=89957 /ORGANISM="Polarella glacialis, Strain CCMP 1383" /LENGTH=180 /DNA_ID=CAMNT_0002573151 /DNA_START=489 /DNA_END=1031 /DNA_ORIENTATION=+